MPLFGPNINKMKERRDIEGLIKELLNKDVRVRIDVIKALGELKCTKGLITALKNDRPEVRIEAISALEDINEPEVNDALVDALYTEEVETVWQKAFEAISKTLEAAVIKQPSATEDIKKILESVGIELLKSGRDKFALKCFEKVAQISPDKETLGSLGSTLIDHELFEDALKFFQKIIDFDPSDARGWAGKGMALSRMAEELIGFGYEEEERKQYFKEAEQYFQEAINCCKKALKIEPKFKAARDTLTGIHYAKGDYQSMCMLIEETLKTDPHDIKAHVMLAEALCLSGEIKEAESKLKKALELLNQSEYIQEEDLSIVHQQLGILYAMRGDQNKAIEEFKEAARANPKDQWSYKLLDAYMILNMFGEAMKGNPLERRTRLLGLAKKRAREYISLDHWEAEWSGQTGDYEN